ncbi:hypothetical protein DFP73DRAFT_596132 [Morchella snyderi]|nr:hypothetical protein DFP73DRAFT_596132 [Morchella snyderi]
MLSVLLLLQLGACVLGAPIPGESMSAEQDYTTLKPEPKTRGTLGIIRTCGTTLKLQLSFDALVTPEEILKDAMKHWDKARRLHRALTAVKFITEKRQERPSTEPTAETIDASSISMKVTYFVVAGGFVRTDGYKKPITYSEFFHAFVEDPLSVSCKAQRLPIKLLEVPVGIHILIAAVMYVLWWSKQLDVNEPIILPLDTTGSSEHRIKQAKQCEKAMSEVVAPREGTWSWSVWGWLLMADKREEDEKWKRAEEQIAAIPMRRESSPIAAEVKCQKYMRRAMDSEHQPPSFELTVSDGDGRGNQAETAAVGQNANNLHLGSALGMSCTQGIRSCTRSSITTLCGSLSGESSSIPPPAEKSDAPFLHATAWNSHFPSTAERWIWRGSCLAVGFVPVVLFLGSLLKALRKLLDITPGMKGGREWFEWILRIMSIVAAGVLLIFSFVDLRHSRGEVFDVVPWVTSVGHF